MSKRKKKFKKYHAPSPTIPASSTQPPAGVVSSTSQPTSSPVVSPAPKPEAVDSDGAVYAAHKTEYDHIHKDLIKVLVVNGLLFVGVLVIYFVNKQNGFLDSLFNQIF